LTRTIILVANLDPGILRQDKGIQVVQTHVTGFYISTGNRRSHHSSASIRSGITEWVNG
jgi:hypothetical protein